MQLEPIAIIGIGCRFPGAKNPQAFWSMIRDGIDGVSEVPQSRWDVDAYYDPDKTKPGKANTRWGGFLEDIEQFDPQFFWHCPQRSRNYRSSTAFTFRSCLGNPRGCGASS